MKTFNFAEEDAQTSRPATVQSWTAPDADLAITVTPAADEPTVVGEDQSDALVVFWVDQGRAELGATRREFLELLDDLVEQWKERVRWTVTDREFLEEGNC